MLPIDHPSIAKASVERLAREHDLARCKARALRREAISDLFSAVYRIISSAIRKRVHRATRLG
jgi:hypothetical protein